MIIDAVLLLFLLVGILSGVRRGLLAALFSWGTFIVAFLAALRFALPVGQFLDRYIGFSGFVRRYLVSRIPNAIAYSHVSAHTLRQALQYVVIPAPFKQTILASIHGTGTVIDLLATPMIAIVDKLVGFLVVLFVVQFVLRIALGPLLFSVRWLVPRPLDQLGGAVFGAGYVLLEYWGLVLVLPFIAHIPGFPPHIATALEQSSVLRVVSKTFAPLVHFVYSQLHLAPTYGGFTGGETI